MLAFSKAMSVKKNPERIKLELKSSVRYFAWLILLSFSFSLTPVRAFQTSKSADAVYCPLQKIWVERYVPTAKVENPLKNICAADDGKKTFLFELSKKYAARQVGDSAEVEHSFFNYVDNGKRASAVILPSQSAPEPQLDKSAATEKITGGYQNFFIKKSAADFVLPRKARPPTVVAETIYNSKTFQELTSISRRIKPRAPPVSL